MPEPTLRVELDLASIDLDEAQRIIDHGKKTIAYRLPILKQMIDSRQSEIDFRRRRIQIAYDYLDATGL